MHIQLRRRDLLLLLGAAAATRPLAARAQQTRRRIGVLLSFVESDPQAQIRVKALEVELQKLGWTLGHNLLIDYRWAGGDGNRFRLHAAAA